MNSIRPVTILFCCAILASCSTTRNLPEGQYRLAGTSLTLNGSGIEGVSNSQLVPYIKQQPNNSVLGFNPFICIYNWSDGSDKGLNKLWEKIGEAPVVYNPALTEASERSIARRMEYYGYFDSSVSAELRTKGRKAYVKYTVTPGMRYVIDTLCFELPSGEEFVSDFKSLPEDIHIAKGSYLSESALEEESARCASALRNMGYFALNRSSFRYVADTLYSSGHASVRCIVNENEYPLRKVSMGEVSINYPQEYSFNASLLDAMNLIRPGSLYNETQVNNTYSRFSSLKVFSSVGIELTQVADDRVNCDVNLVPSLTQGFKVNLEASTNSSALIGISPQLEYYHKNLFGGGEWLSLAFTGNFQFRPNDSARATEFGAAATLSLPEFLGLPMSLFTGPYIPRTEFTLSFNHQNRPEYNRNIFSLSFGYSGRLRNNVYYKLYPLQVNYVILGDLDKEFAQRLERNPFMKYAYQNHLDAGVGGTIYHSTSGDVVPKTSYISNRFTFDLSGNVLSLFSPLLNHNESDQALIFGAPFSQYVRGEYSFARGIRFGKLDNQTFAFRLLAGVGVAYGNSTSMPYEKQFYCGGAQSMRGWQARSLGPGTSKPETAFAIPSQTGDLKLEADIEYRFPIVKILEGAIFAEAGNVWEMKDFSFPEGIAVDYGIGLRLNIDFMLVRLDFGVQLRNPSNETSKWMTPSQAFSQGGYAFHFGIGYPF
ncbi:MAG: sorting and assembly machinery component 50 [Bacteroidales bacterium]|nr:sorting and assembly machinery component 50 [Bacteroidales bacterium]